MKDNEIIAILEGCDEAQRARVMAWARKRWPAPKKTAKAAPAQAPLPAAQPIDPEAFRKLLEEMRRAQPATPPDPSRYPQWPPPVVPERRQVIPDYWLDPNLRYPIVCGDTAVTTLSSHKLTVDIGASWPLTQARPSWSIRNGSPS